MYTTMILFSQNWRWITPKQKRKENHDIVYCCIGYQGRSYKTCMLMRPHVPREFIEKYGGMRPKRIVRFLWNFIWITFVDQIGQILKPKFYYFPNSIFKSPATIVYSVFPDYYFNFYASNDYFVAKNYFEQYSNNAPVQWVA